MAYKRVLFLLGVLLLSAVLRDMVVPREFLEEWMGRWLGGRSAQSSTHKHPGDLP